VINHASGLPLLAEAQERKPYVPHVFISNDGIQVETIAGLIKRILKQNV